MKKYLIFTFLVFAHWANAQTEEELWRKFVLDPKEENIKQFIANYPKSTLLTQMSELLWGQCKANLDKKNCELYIQYFPLGEHVGEAGEIRSRASNLEIIVDGVTDAVEDISQIFSDDDEPLQDNDLGGEPENQFGDDAEIADPTGASTPNDNPPPKPAPVNKTPVARTGAKPGKAPKAPTTATKPDKPKSAPAKQARPKPSAWFGNVTMQHNYVLNKEKGLLIHLKLKVEGMRGQTCVATAYFFDETKAPIRDHNGKYKNSKGNVVSTRKFIPKTDGITYNDFKLFMPYAELHRKNGKHKILFYVSVKSSNGTLAKSKAGSFTLSWR